jgi:glycosyltransferase involved in cell wall biosynthesis
MIRLLGRRHDLTLVTYCSSEESRQRHELLRYCRSIYAAGWGGSELPGAQDMPSSVRALRRSTMVDALRAIPSHLYDAALIDSIFLAAFRLEISTPAILGEHNIESHLLKQVAQTDIRSPTGELSDPGREADLMRKYEDQVWPEFAVRLAVNPEERDEIQRRARVGRTLLVENGADPDLWLANARQDTDRVLFVGTLGWYPNSDAISYLLNHIWPVLLRRRPSAKLIVAGSAVTAELRTLLQHQPGLTLIENPPDVRQIAALASVSIAPLRLGAGTRTKILDSMALGIPVVSTSLGCAGLAVEDGQHLLIRDDAVEFAEAIEELFRNRALWRRLRQNGKALIEERYQWDKVLAPLETALLEQAH